MIEQLAANSAVPDWRRLVDETRSKIRAELGDRQLTPPEEIIRQM